MKSIIIFLALFAACHAAPTTPADVKEAAVALSRPSPIAPDVISDPKPDEKVVLLKSEPALHRQKRDETAHPKPDSVKARELLQHNPQRQSESPAKTHEPLQHDHKKSKREAHHEEGHHEEAHHEEEPKKDEAKDGHSHADSHKQSKREAHHEEGHHDEGHHEEEPKKDEAKDGHSHADSHKQSKREAHHEEGHHDEGHHEEEPKKDEAKDGHSHADSHKQSKREAHHEEGHHEEEPKKDEAKDGHSHADSHKQSKREAHHEEGHHDEGHHEEPKKDALPHALPASAPAVTAPKQKRNSPPKPEASGPDHHDIHHHEEKHSAKPDSHAHHKQRREAPSKPALARTLELELDPKQAEELLKSSAQRHQRDIPVPTEIKSTAAPANNKATTELAIPIHHPVSVAELFHKEKPADAGSSSEESKEIKT
ncbi:histidine-rich glycoprotein isoform X4 [Drosophila obscura]|uniref:histidine-rich glycoprotein isoform X4 n=1 Tax=Drosophila obscura TaxID=7282 RepID=UPI001BB1BB65|nr:histidine-rich glycoprotein isoform X4 [Drosophila obscura]